ncbi:MAG TPA: hypothetical protein PLS28_05765, partial [Clostridiales bacterium]|nr:hypothetical protein [Clostridiales bacterium]
MLPDWMKEEEDYAAVKDSDRFLEKTLLKLMGTLSGLRHQVTAKRLEGSAPVALLSALLLLLLTACAKNMFFPYCMLALVLLGLCLLPGPLLKQSLGNIAAATGIAFLILLPSALLGNTHTLVTVCLKVFISVSLVVS